MSAELRPPAPHVLVVARWYPAHDTPGRGSFVADHVSALAAAGARVTVASFEVLPLAGDDAARGERSERAAALVEEAVGSPGGASAAVGRPVSWGAPGVGVARLPVVAGPAERGAAEEAAAHARPLRAFARALHAQAPIDVVHAHTGLPDGAASAAVADMLGVPLLVTEHSSSVGEELAQPGAADLYRSLVRPGRQVVAVSAALAGTLASATNLPIEAFRLLPNAVPVEEFPAGPPEDRAAGELLFVGARRATKGIETLLRALAQLRRDGRPSSPAARPRLRVIGAPGSAEDEARWSAVIEELGLRNAVSFDGAMDRAGVAEAMRRADVFVHPSPRETFGMVAAEAIASGLPVAATPSGGVEEIVGDDGSLGTIASSADAPALAAAVADVLARRQSFDAEAMHRSVVDRYAAASVAARTLALYRGLAAELGGSAGKTHALKSEGHGFALFDPADVEPPPLVVGSRGPLAALRLASLPPDLLGRLVVATQAITRPVESPPAVRSWLVHEPEAEFRRRLAFLGGAAPADRGRHLLQAITSPNAERKRRDLVARRDEVRRESRDLFLREAWELAERPRFAVGIEASDVALIAEVLGPLGVRLAPGWLRWLTDRWDEAGRAAG